MLSFSLMVKQRVKKNCNALCLWESAVFFLLPSGKPIKMNCPGKASHSLEMIIHLDGTPFMLP